MIKHNQAPIFTFRLLFTVVLVSALVVGQQTPTNLLPHNDEFVKRDGARLTLGGETFRYSGPNI